MNTNADITKKKSFRLTQVGNAKRLVARHGENIRYCHEWKKWLIWNGKYWEVDTTNEIRRRAEDTIDNIYKEAKGKSDKTHKALISHANKSETKRQLVDMVSLAGDDINVIVKSGDLDKDHWKLNVENGTIDLQTGKRRDHKREDYITKIANAVYDNKAKCPTWDTFLDRILEGNNSVIKFLQKAIGYSLTGDTSEQCLFFLYGKGANGKTTLLETISTMLNDYAEQADFSTFLEQKNTIRNDLAGLKGARFVPGVEAEKGKKFAEAFIKRVTGQDTVKARFLYKEFFSFKPTFKVFLGANHRPTIKGTDNAIWRRPILIPFNVEIPEDEMDKKIQPKFRKEMSGILNWAIKGCLTWQKEGLKEPEEIKHAKEQYRQDMDVLRGFLKDCCVLKSSAKVSSSDLYQAYNLWCQREDEEPITQQQLGILLKERDLKPGHSGSIRHWKGIELNQHTIEWMDATEYAEDIIKERQEWEAEQNIIEADKKSPF